MTERIKHQGFAMYHEVRDLLLQHGITMPPKPEFVDLLANDTALRRYNVHTMLSSFTP